jgi:hypothetical protein
VTSRYTELYTKQYRERGFETVLVEVRRRRVIQSAREHPHDRVVELGCGLEPLFDALAAEIHVVVEPSATFAAHARDAAARRPGARVIEAYAEEAHDQLLAVKPQFVIVSSLLHEVPDPVRLIGLVRSISTDTTVAHFNVPNVNSFHRLLALEAGLITDVFEESEMDQRFARHTRFDAEKLVGMLEAGGFRVIDSGSYFVKPFTHDQLDAMTQAGIIDEPVLRGLEGMVKYMPGLGSEIYADVTPA